MFNQALQRFEFQVQGMKGACYSSIIPLPWSDLSEVYSYHHYAFGIQGDTKFAYIDGVEVSVWLPCCDLSLPVCVWKMWQTAGLESLQLVRKMEEGVASRGQRSRKKGAKSTEEKERKARDLNRTRTSCAWCYAKHDRMSLLSWVTPFPCVVLSSALELLPFAAHTNSCSLIVSPCLLFAPFQRLRISCPNQHMTVLARRLALGMPLQTIKGSIDEVKAALSSLPLSLCGSLRFIMVSTSLFCSCRFLFLCFW